jgi:DUF3108-like
MNRNYQWIILVFWSLATAGAADSPSAKPLYSLAPGTKWNYEETQEIVQVIGSRTNATHVTGTIDEEILPAPAHYKENGDTVLSRSTTREKRETNGGLSEGSGGTVQILGWRGDDLYLYGVRAWVDGSYSEGMNLYQPPLLYLKSSARTGESWTVGKEKNMGADLTTTATMETPETITVPAGTFSNCLKIAHMSTVESLGGESRVETGIVEDTIWYAKAVGVVKEFQVSTFTYVNKEGRIFNRQEVTRALLSHTPAK